MARAKVETVNYHVFMAQVRKARDAGQLLEKARDKDAWRAYVREHDVKEASLEAIGKKQSITGKMKAVIITGDGPWSAYYLYLPDDEHCMKFIPATAD